MENTTAPNTSDKTQSFIWIVLKLCNSAADGEVLLHMRENYFAVSPKKFSENKVQGFIFFVFDNMPFTVFNVFSKTTIVLSFLFYS